MNFTWIKNLMGRQPVDEARTTHAATAEIVDTTGGILTVKVRGKLKHADLVAMQKSAAEYIRKNGKVKFLVITEDFQGWERQGDWGDVSFSGKYDAYIEKMAIVGEKKWEDLALVFVAKGFRPVAIEYFLHEQLDQARAWLK
jgi:hypothetical protein